MKTIFLDGANFSDIPTFYEEINRLFMFSEDWKVGETLDGFNDLLYGGTGILANKEKIQLVWLNFNKSKQDLGLKTTLDYYNRKLAHPEIFNTSWVNEKIEALHHGGGQTYLEIILEIIVYSGRFGLADKMCKKKW